MIKITKNTEEQTCNCCSSKHDVYDVELGRNENRTMVISLCPACRKQLSNMLTKRVKE